MATLAVPPRCVAVRDRGGIAISEREDAQRYVFVKVHVLHVKGRSHRAINHGRAAQNNPSFQIDRQMETIGFTHQKCLSSVYSTRFSQNCWTPQVMHIP